MTCLEAASETWLDTCLSGAFLDCIATAFNITVTQDGDLLHLHRVHETPDETQLFPGHECAHEVAV